LRIVPEKISSELYLGQGSALGYLMPSLYHSLFKHFRPTTVPPIEMLTDRTGAIDPQQVHIVYFPVKEVNSLRDLLLEIDQLKHLDLTNPQEGSSSSNPKNRPIPKGNLTKTTDKMSDEERG
jgi:hypothetical protein